MANIVTALSLSVKEIYTLDSFIITSVELKPSVSANIYICITASNNKIFVRTVSLVGDDYTAWTSDDYLYKYISDNIERIFYSI